MPPPERSDFSRRERQIMDVIYARGEATAAEVREAIPSPPSYSAVRATMRVLVEKGHLEHRTEGQRYVFRPTVPAPVVREDALKEVVKSFFGGSRARALAALLGNEAEPLSEDEAERMRAMIERARGEGR